jgi:ADP-dependent NAD(P)H-hydrate dehydratase / NAD(P)H-hydrate epimerase
MQRIAAGPAWPLFDIAATRRIEERAAASLPPHTLMQRAGLATARLALAIAPHARCVWLACGPGNNGGDGLEAAVHLQAWGKSPVVTWLGDPDRAPPDARLSRQRAQAAGVTFADEPPPIFDLCVDALLGIGPQRAAEGRMAHWIARMNTAGAPVLAVDVPSGLAADTGAGGAVRADHTLSMLVLKPGLFTANGRDHAGQVWLAALGVEGRRADASAELIAAPDAQQRRHASHKGSYGDVAVIGGAPGMSGAALLAGSGALHGGAGRVYVGLLGDEAPVIASQPELMLRDWQTLDLGAMAVACGCGGGQAVHAALPRVIARSRSLVLDADALNAIAADAQLQAALADRAARGAATVLTPHPLEAARLLDTNTAALQTDRLAAAQALALKFGCVVVLKGSGTVVAAPQQRPAINPTGNARLATAGTGDVLAGLVAARLAGGQRAFEAACAAVYVHGLAADRWPGPGTLTAGALAAFA